MTLAYEGMKEAKRRHTTAPFLHLNLDKKVCYRLGDHSWTEMMFPNRDTAIAAYALMYGEPPDLIACVLMERVKDNWHYANSRMAHPTDYARLYEKIHKRAPST